MAAQIALSLRCIFLTVIDMKLPDPKTKRHDNINADG
jgi:hypothetical protein